MKDLNMRIHEDSQIPGMHTVYINDDVLLECLSDDEVKELSINDIIETAESCLNMKF